jgi:SAM-dependent methyltransferase
VSFKVRAEAYDRSMGRYSGPLAPVFADFAGVRGGERVLDVGCGTGALTAELVRLVGPALVAAVDPSEPFVEAAGSRHPGVDVRHGFAEELPFDDRQFDAALSQLVVHFMADPSIGLREMARVTRPGGTAAACVWDHGCGRGPLGVFWQAARELEPDVDDESRRPGTRRGHLGELFRAAGLRDVVELELYVRVEHPSFEEWWEPFMLGVGPAGQFVASLPERQRDELRERCRDRLPPAPFPVEAIAWAARGVA